MYGKFFGLSQMPFNNTPDPRFFFNTPQHEEALASLRYTAEQRKGFILLTGEVGSGKTLMGRLFLEQLGSRAHSASVSNSSLSPRDLLISLCHELRIQVDPADTLPQIRTILQEYLLTEYAKNRIVVVVLDEAQNLPQETFEELRMLGNLESNEAKLLQVVILGQPELLGVFQRPEMQQLQQRLFRSLHLGALSFEETAGYIGHRLAVAGGGGKVDFTAGAIELIHTRSGGMPRLINQLCDHAMLTAYSQSATRIDLSIVQSVVDNLRESSAGGATSFSGPSASVEETAAETRSSRRRRRPRRTEDVGADVSSWVESTVYQAEQALSDLRKNTDEMIDEADCRVKELKSSDLRAVKDRTDDVRRSLSGLRQEAERILEDVSQRRETLESVGMRELQERIIRAEHTVQELQQGADRILVQLDQRSNAFKGGELKDLQERMGQAEQVLESFRRNAGQVLGEVEGRIRSLETSGVNRLEAGVRRVEGLVETLSRNADQVIEQAQEKVRVFSESILRPVEERLSSLEQKQVRVSEECQQAVDLAGTKSAELQVQCVLLKRILSGLSEKTQLAEQQSDRLSKENTRAELVEAAIQQADRVIALLGQSRQSTEKHTQMLREQMDRAEELGQQVPQLVSQLQSATGGMHSALLKTDGEVKAIEGRLAVLDEQWQLLSKRQAEGVRRQLQSAREEAETIVNRMNAEVAKVKDEVVRTQLDQIREQSQILLKRMIDQLAKVKEEVQAAAVESQVLSGKLETQIAAMKSQVGTGQRQLATICDVLSRIGSLGQSLSDSPASAPKPEPRFHDVSPASAPSPASVESSELVEYRQIASSSTPAAPAVQDVDKTDDELPPLIEFDPRRAAIAFRIAAGATR